ncbi:Scr1 family TA system antitoxin-like transcriptional regulator [Streptomyces sp. NPDC059862]|uniref:Scr1 family TA system antitoxin-like transcriptional regulator n=1 Tax=unclassified Streptomyces TaxID=2593676 RepID=UPI00362E8267
MADLRAGRQAVQLDRLVSLSRLPNVAIEVVPLSGRMPDFPMTCFSIHDDRLVIVETFHSELTTRDPRDRGAGQAEDRRVIGSSGGVWSRCHWSALTRALVSGRVLALCGGVGCVGDGVDLLGWERRYAHRMRDLCGWASLHAVTGSSGEAGWGRTGAWAEGSGGAVRRVRPYRCGGPYPPQAPDTRGRAGAAPGRRASGGARLEGSQGALP